MEREELIKEAASIVYGTVPASVIVPWREVDRNRRVEFEAAARAILAVFEKAHTPTDDEREALAEVIARGRRGWERNGGRVDSMTLRDAILAAGFRRSEVPVPTCTCGEVLGSHAINCPAFTEPQGEPSDAREARARILAKLDRIPDSDAVTLDKADLRAALRAAVR